jgi:hypothetical protein
MLPLVLCCCRPHPLLRLMILCNPSGQWPWRPDSTCLQEFSVWYHGKACTVLLMQTLHSNSELL